MKKSHHLHELIHAMTKNEKRYFKICASKHVIGKENNYVRLFDFVAKQSVPNDKEIKNHFSRENFVKRLSAAKYDLYNLILRSLNEYHSTGSVKSQLRDQTQRAEVLINKALYDQALKSLHSAKKIAYQYEELNFLLEIIGFELSIIQRRGQSAIEEKQVQSLEKESSDIVESIRLIETFNSVSSQMMNLMSTIGSPRSAEEKKRYNTIVQIPEWKMNVNDHLLSVQVSFYRAQSIYFYAFQDLKKSFQVASKRVHLFEENIENISNPTDFLSALYNQELLANQLMDFETGRKIRQKILSFEENHPNWKLTENNNVLIFKSLNNELIFLIETAQYKKAQELVNRISSELPLYEGKLGQLDEVVLLYNIVNLYIYSSNYDKALTWISKLLNHEAAQHRKDVYAFARILNLLIHFELDNIDVLPYYIRSTKRFLNKLDRSFETELLLVSFISKNLKHRGEDKQAELQSAYKKIMTDIQAVFEARPNEKEVLTYFDLNTFLKSKVNGVSFMEQYKKDFPERIME